jgi:hypothetical protein
VAKFSFTTDLYSVVKAEFIAMRLACQSIKEAVSENKKLARKYPLLVLGAAG